MSLEGKVAIVTGASRGIGRAIVIALAQAGAKVVINFQQNETAAKETLKKVEETGKEGLIFQADISSAMECEKMVSATLDHFGRIDILVNNAGISKDNLLATMKTEEWKVVLDTNLNGVFNCSKAVLKPLLKQKSGGKIINIASVVGLTGNSGQANYAAAKAGIIAFTKSLAKEVGKRAINVNAVAPGFIETEMTESLSPKLKETMLSQVSMKRYGKAEEVAEVVLFLAESANYVNGTVITVDGGLTYI